MPTDLIPPGRHLVLTFPGSRHERKKIYIEASDDISIYVTTPTGARRFANGDEVRPLYEDAEDVQVFSKKVVVPKRSRWCVILVNEAASQTDWDNARAVHYDIDD